MEAGPRKGFFISLEGVEGSGKTTQAGFLEQYLISSGVKVLLTKEPGGTQLGVAIRDVLLWPGTKGVTPMAELLLYSADRAQHLAEQVLPALNEGVVVITDRFSDSTIAYQGYGRGIDQELLSSLDVLAAGGLRPDLTILFDLDVVTGLNRKKAAGACDRMECEDISFHQRVRVGFRDIASRAPARFETVDASLPESEIRDIVCKIVGGKLGLGNNGH